MAHVLFQLFNVKRYKHDCSLFIKCHGVISYFFIIIEGVERQFEIYKTDIEQPGFREYHERLQTFILFYIDAASYIDVDDERWSFYLLLVNILFLLL